jgi:FlaA1/EpsC-like NDP-sugar epimerase
MYSKKELILRYRRPLAGLAHVFLIAAAYFLSFYIRFEFKIPPSHFGVFANTFLYLVLIKAIVFYFFRLYEGLWRYVGIYDVLQVLKANLIATLAFFFYIMIFYKFVGFPRSIFIIDFILCVGFMFGIRLSSRCFREIFSPVANINKTRVLIVGAGEAGIMVLKELKLNAYCNVIGFVDDDIYKKHGRVSGLKVLGATDEISDIVQKYSIEEIIISIPSASGKAVRGIISKCEPTKAKIKILPGLSKIISGEVTVRDIREVKPEDLLDRKPVVISTEDIGLFIKGKTVLITGAGGSIGSELCRQAARFLPRLLVLYDYNENNVFYLQQELNRDFPDLKYTAIIGDIKDIGLLKSTFSQYRPEIVFHSAAHKHVPLMEDNPEAAVKNNIIGTRNFMYAAEHYKVESFVMISTDKAVNPTSVMGASKRVAEMIIQSKAKRARTKFMAVRFGNVIGSSGSVVPLFKRQIEHKGPVTVTDPDVKRYFMTAGEAAQLVLQAGAMGKGGEVFILDMGEQIKVVDLARNLITLSGLKPDIDIEIKFIGLRPGEKMFEEMLLDKERDKATRHDKIYIAQPDSFDHAKLNRDIRALERLAVLMDRDRILGKLKDMVPGYGGGGVSR